MTLLERLMQKVDASGDCWLWTGARFQNGYGHAFLGRRKDPPHHTSAHRAVYEALVGQVPHSLVLDHLCRERLCVNPDHLEPVTQRENLRRGYGNGHQTHCPRGHAYDQPNTRVSARNQRLCRACDREKHRAAKAAKRGAHV